MSKNESGTFNKLPRARSQSVSIKKFDAQGANTFPPSDSKKRQYAHDDSKVLGQNKFPKSGNKQQAQEYEDIYIKSNKSQERAKSIVSPPSYEQAMLDKSNNLMGSELPKDLDENELTLQPKVTEEYAKSFKTDRLLQEGATVQRTFETDVHDKPYGALNSNGVEIVAPSAAILANIEKVQQLIGEQQEQLDKKFVQNIKFSGPKKHQPQIADALKDQSNVQAILNLTNLQQSLATNHIMLVFQQQAERLQEQVDPKFSHYVQYNSKEKKLIAQIQEQSTALYQKGQQLDEQILAEINQKRAAKLVDSKLLDTQFAGLTSELRPRDQGLKLTKVNPHYSLDDLKGILQQFKNANKEMDALIKMPDLAKRSSIISTLYDCIITLAKKAAFLVPQTAVAAVSVVEYGIMTVVVDSAKKGLSSAKNVKDHLLPDKKKGKISQDQSNGTVVIDLDVELSNPLEDAKWALHFACKKGVLGIKQILEQYQERVINRFNKELLQVSVSLDDIPKVNALSDTMHHQMLNNKEQREVLDLSHVVKKSLLNDILQINQNIQRIYQEPKQNLLNEDQRKVLETLSSVQTPFSQEQNTRLIENCKEILKNLGYPYSFFADGIIKLATFENEFETAKALVTEQEKQVKKAESSTMGKLIRTITGISIIGLVTPLTTLAHGVVNISNAMSGVRANYRNKATQRIDMEDEGAAIKNKTWNRSASEIYTAGKEAGDEAHKNKAEAAAARATLQNEIKNQPTRSSQFAIPTNEAKVVDRQDGKVNLRKYIAITEAFIKEKEQALQQYIDGLAGLIKSATPESYIKNRVLTQNKELLGEVIELTKLQQQNAVSNVMLAYLLEAATLNSPQNVKKYSKDIIQVNDEIQDLAQQLAEKTSRLNKKIELEINSKRADRLEKNNLVSELSQLNIDKLLHNISSDQSYQLKDFKEIKKLFQKANKDMDSLLKMPDVSKRCGLLASLYDGASTLAKSSAFLIPKTVAAAVSIVQYAVMTVVVDTISQGWGAAQNAGQGVLDKRNDYIKQKINQRDDAIFKSINKNREEARKLVQDPKENADKIINRLPDGQQKKLYQQLMANENMADIDKLKLLYETMDISQRNQLFDIQKIERAEQELNNLEKQFEQLNKELENVAKQPITRLATAILGVPSAVIWGAISGVAKIAVAGVKNATLQANQGEQLGDKWKQLTRDKHGNKKSWARRAGEVNKGDKDLRGEVYQDKKKRSVAAKLLLERAKSKQNPGTSVPGHS